VIVLSHWPHIRNPVRTGRIAFASALAWLPLAAAACALWPRAFPTTLAATAAVALGFALLSGRGRLYGAATGWCLADAALLALLMPAGTPWHVPALLMAAIGGLRALFRNRGFTPPLNFTAVALAASLLLTDRAALAVSGPGLGEGFGTGSFYFLSGYWPLAATLLLLPAILGRWFKWTSLLSFLLAAGGAAAVAGYLNGWQYDVSAVEPQAYAALVAGIGLVADQRSSPLARGGQAWAGIVAGLLFALFAWRGLPYQGMVIAPLAANLLTPLLDYRAGAPQAAQ